MTPNGLRLVDDVLRCVGLAAAHTGNEDPSTITYQRCVAAMKETAKAAKSQGIKTLFEKFSFAFAMIPTLLLAFLAFFCARRGTEGATNRSIKMALTALFLRWV